MLTYMGELQPYSLKFRPMDEAAIAAMAFVGDVVTLSTGPCFEN